MFENFICFTNNNKTVNCIPEDNECEKDDIIKGITKTVKNMDSVKFTIYVYLYTIIVTFSILVLFLGIRSRSAIIISLIVGQLVINFFCFPTSINVYSEFNSYNALYTFIQLVTPIIVFTYAVYMAWNDHINSHIRYINDLSKDVKNPIGLDICSKGLSKARKMLSTPLKR